MPPKKNDKKRPEEEKPDEYNPLEDLGLPYEEIEKARAKQKEFDEVAQQGLEKMAVDHVDRGIFRK